MKKKTNSRIRVPNGLLYFLVYIIIYPVLKLLFKLKVDRDSYHPGKGSFIVVCNHQSFMDFLLSMLSLYPRRVNTVAAQKFFFYRPLDKLLPIMGCIPKNLFDPDPRSIIGMLSVIKRGGRLLLFPEGRCTVDGAYMGMHKSTGKLIKKLGTPVVSCHIDGAYNCMPFWRKGIRLGRVRVTLANLFSSEDIKQLSVDDINRSIDARLSGHDDNPVNKPLRLIQARRLTEGLEYILYYCPACDKDSAFLTSGNYITCKRCGNTAVMDRHSVLSSVNGDNIPRTIHEWYKLQAIFEARELIDNHSPITIPVTVIMPRGVGDFPTGQGELSLVESGWRYTGTLSNENIQLFFPLETVPALPFDPNEDFQIYSGGNFYMFTPKNNFPGACSKYATLGESEYWNHVKEIRMTKGFDSGFSSISNCSGDISAVPSPLFSISGSVISGKHMGRTVGMPTANICTSDDISKIKPGVYAVKVIIDAAEYRGITHIGTRPSIDSDTGITIETFIFSFSRDLYGKNLSLLAYEYIRPTMSFSSLEKLKEQVDRDILRVNDFFDSSFTSSE